jgi:hypothetical protein
MISIYIDYKLQRFQPEIKYTFGFILQSLGYSYSFISDTGQLKNNDLLMIYGYTDPTVSELTALAQHYATVFIQSDPDLFDPKVLTPEKIRQNLHEVKLLSPTPVLSARKISYPAVNYTESGIHAGKITFDLVGNIFFHLASLEQTIDAQHIENGYYRDSFSAFYNYRETPYVDNMLWLLDSMIKEHTRSNGRYTVQKHYWPEGQQAAVALTHSVDDLQKWNFASLMVSSAEDIAMLFTLKWRQLAHNLKNKLKYLFTNYELYWNFDEYRKLERESGCRSSWFIATEANDDIDYSLDDPDLQEEIRQILKEGGEIGLLTTADKLNRDDFVTRKQILLHLLRKDQIGARQLGYRMNNSLRDLHNKLSPSYSQSEALQEAPGFRNGISIPWHPWIGTMKAGYLNIPTVYRDQYLMVNKYKALQLDDAKHQVKKYFQFALRIRGVFGVDFRLATYTDIPYCEKLYAYILALVKSGATWIATSQEIASWWEKRSRVTIEQGEYEISVYFPDNLEHIVLQVFGGARVKEIDGASGKIDGNIIRFSNVKANSIAIIRLQPHQ